ncbi:rhodanese-like domain-containing protein [Arhodomonas aquaeolei]|uniref:sulfurtransferase n=1 Tax=Arhodomonas TaxID=2368 RepID=UPI0013D5F117|nr:MULTISPECIES: rhodanese-like domain-containing protein [Arhodomonas]MCS4503704.1 rhodanese-like domain-containing protein [Arhodomonas aquaeolei]
MNDVRLLRTLRNAAAAALMLLPTALLAATAPLVSADWLGAHREEVTVIETAKDPALFDGVGHIAGAVFVPYGDIAVERETDDGPVDYLVPDAGAFTALMRDAGVDAGGTVVIAPAGTRVAGDMTVAARLYWALRYYGHDDVAVLDGGAAAWAAAGGGTADSPAGLPGDGDFAARLARPGIRVSTADVADVLENGGATLVDNRPLTQYTGLAGKDYVDGLGHLPGARPVPFDLFSVSRDGIHYWRDGEAVRRILAAMDVGEDQPVIAYCNSGHVSSMAWFAISEIGGRDDTALYDGSLHAWTRSADRRAMLRP